MAIISMSIRSFEEMLDSLSNFALTVGWAIPRDSESASCVISRSAIAALARAYQVFIARLLPSAIARDRYGV